MISNAFSRVYIGVYISYGEVRLDAYGFEKTAVSVVALLLKYLKTRLLKVNVNACRSFISGFCGLHKILSLVMSFRDKPVRITLYIYILPFKLTIIIIIIMLSFMCTKQQSILSTTAVLQNQNGR